MEEPFYPILRGSLTEQYISSAKRTIKLILASTDTDFTEERDSFWADIVPELQQHCLQYGAELCVIDPYQGADVASVARDPIRTSRTFDISLIEKELNDAKEQSAGVCFVCFCGDKYGLSPLPATLKQDEFDQIQNSAHEAGKDVRALSEWYKLDRNAVPPVHQLQTTNSKNKTMGVDAFAELQLLIHRGAAKGTRDEDAAPTKITQLRQDEIYSSWIERCARAAAQRREDCARCLFVLRRLEGIPDPLKDRNGNKRLGGGLASDVTLLVDPLTTSRDPLISESNPSRRLGNLKNDISATLDKPNVETFLVPYVDQWRASKEHQKYMERFVPQVSYKLKQLIDQAFRHGSQPACVMGGRRNANEAWRARLAYDARSHMLYALRHRALKFTGRQKLLQSIGEIFNASASTKQAPIIIRGEDGSGKTAAIAQVMHHAQEWFGGNAEPVLVARFMNLYASTDIQHELVSNLCHQLSACYGLELGTWPLKCGHDLEKLGEWFNFCLEQISTLVAKYQGGVIPQSNVESLLDSGSIGSKIGSQPHLLATPLVILIDDLYLLKIQTSLKGVPLPPWIPAQLPQNVIMVLTLPANTQPQTLPIAGDKVNYCILDLEQFSADTVVGNLFQTQLTSLGRTLSADQMASVNTCLQNAPKPVFAYLLAHEASKWPSFNSTNGLGALANTVGGYFDQYLGRLEQKFGSQIISSICGFLECSHYGLTECELLDLLSSSEDIMTSLQSKPSTCGGGKILRFPAMLWMKIKREIELFVEPVLIDGYFLYRWRWHAVRNAVKHKYLQTSQQRKKYHSVLADLFSNSLAEMESGNVDSLKQKALCNFDYLDALVQSFGVSHLLAVLEGVMFQVLHKDFQVLYYSILMPSLASLFRDPLLFAGEVIGRLRFMRETCSTHLTDLIESAMAWVDNYSFSPIMVPLTYWIKPNKESIILSMQISDWDCDTTIVLPTLNCQHLLVSGRKNSGSIRMYHISSQKLVRTFPGHNKRILAMCLSSDGHFFVSGSEDRTLKAWDLIQGTCIRTMTVHTDKVLSLAITSDNQYLISGSHDETVKIISLETGQVEKSLEGQGGAVHALLVTSSNEILVTGSDDFNVRVWIIETGELVSQISGLMAPVTALCVTSNDTFLAVACDDETLHIYSLCSASQLHELRQHEGKTTSLAIAPDDCQLFVGSSDGNIYVYDLHSRELLETKPCCSTSVTTVQARGDFLVTAGGDSVRVWNIDYRKICGVSPNLRKNSEDIGNNSSGSAGSKKASIISQQTSSLALNKMLPSAISSNRLEENFVSCVCISRNSRYGAAGTAFGFVFCWDLETCQVEWRSFHTPEQRVTALCFGPDAEQVLSGTETGSVCVWNILNGKIIRVYNGHKQSIKYIQAFGDASRVVSSDLSDAIHIWQMAENFQSASSLSQSMEDGVITFKGAKGFCALVPGDRDLIAQAPDADKEARIWSITAEGVNVRGRFTHVDTITCLIVSKGGKVAVTGSKDQSLKVWEIATGFLTQVLVGHEDTVNCCAVSEDARIVASGGMDRSMILWDVETGTILKTLNAHTEPVTGISISADGAVCISVSTDGWMYAWSLTHPGQQLALFNAHIGLHEIHATPDFSRILLLPERTRHLPIVCLHNSPVVLRSHSFGRRGRKFSVSSNESAISHGSQLLAQESRRSLLSNASPRSKLSLQETEITPLSTESAPPVVKKKRSLKIQNPRKLFAKLEHKSQRMSMYNSSSKMVVGGSSADSTGSDSKKLNGGSTSAEKSTVCSLV